MIIYSNATKSRDIGLVVDDIALSAALQVTCIIYIYVFQLYLI